MHTHAMKPLLVILALLFLQCTACATGGPGPKPMPGPAAPVQGSPGDSFAGFDANRDGVLSRKEFEKAFPKMRPGAFDRIDANRDAVIDRREWDAFRASHGKDGMPPQGMPPQMGQTGQMRKPGMPAQSPPPAREPARPGILPPPAR